MSEDWSKEAAKRLRERADLERQRESLVLQEEKMRNEQGPYLWSALKSKVEEMCESLNREYGETILECVVVRSAELKVRTATNNGRDRELYASFAPTSAPNALGWGISDPEEERPPWGEYGLEQVGGKIVFLANDPGRIMQSPEAIAKTMLNALLG